MKIVQQKYKKRIDKKNIGLIILSQVQGGDYGQQ